MTVTYTSLEKIAGLLQVPVFNATTQPTDTQVTHLIERAQDKIDVMTGHAWRTTTINNEIHDIDLPYESLTGVPIYLNHRSITSITKLEVFNGSNWVDFVATKTEDRNKDYWVDYMKGIIFLRTSFSFGPRRVRVSYSYGESSVPYDIEDACTKLVAIDLLSSEDRSVLLPEGTSNLSLQSKAEQWKRDVDEILERRREWNVLAGR